MHIQFRLALVCLAVFMLVQAQEAPSAVQKALVISAEPAGPANSRLELVTQGLAAAAVPYDILIASTEDLTDSGLRGSDGKGKYSAIVLTEGGLGFQNGDIWESAFNDEEWARLWAYELEVGARQGVLYLYPSSYPEDYGLSLVAVRDTGKFPSDVVPTPAANGVLAVPAEGVTIREAYMYLAQPEQTSDNVVTPLLETASGNMVAVLSVTPDGRERLAFTMAQGLGLEHSELFTAALIDWTQRIVPATSTASAARSRLPEQLDGMRDYSLIFLSVLFALLALLLIVRLQRKRRATSYAFQPNPVNADIAHLDLDTPNPDADTKVSIYNLRSKQ